MPPTTTPLTQPLTTEQIKAALDDDGYVTGDILLDLDDAIDGDLDYWLDLCSERLVGSTCGMDINYAIIGTQEGSLIMRVSLDPSMAIDIEG